MTAAPMKILNDLRSARGFDAGEVAIAKIALMSRWFREQNLDAAVVGVSGGVDSALVLALLVAVMKQPASQFRRVVALLMPIESVGATHQMVATARGREVAIALGAEVWEAPRPLCMARESALTRLCGAARRSSTCALLTHHCASTTLTTCSSSHLGNNS
jgi:hypothetical protein